MPIVINGIVRMRIRKECSLDTTLTTKHPLEIPKPRPREQEQLEENSLRLYDSPKPPQPYRDTDWGPRTGLSFRPNIQRGQQSTLGHSSIWLQSAASLHLHDSTLGQDFSIQPSSTPSAPLCTWVSS